MMILLLALASASAFQLSPWTLNTSITELAACDFRNRLLLIAGSGGFSTIDLAGRFVPTPPPPLIGDHMSARRLVNGDCLFVGGFSNGIDGQVLHFNGSWSMWPPLPWLGGSLVMATIDDVVYVGGGLTGGLGGAVSRRFAKFNVTARDQWVMLPEMPYGVHHAAAGADGQKVFVFGGRGAAPEVNSEQVVQIFDPATSTWTTSVDGDVAPLPRGRGGMGKAVFVNGEFAVIGGEASNGEPKLEARTDLYNPKTNAWRPGPPLARARHGIDPIIRKGVVWVVGGGDVAFAWDATNTVQLWDPVAPVCHQEGSSCQDTTIQCCAGLECLPNDLCWKQGAPTPVPSTPDVASLPPAGQEGDRCLRNAGCMPMLVCENNTCIVEPTAAVTASTAAMTASPAIGETKESSGLPGWAIALIVIGILCFLVSLAFGTLAYLATRPPPMVALEQTAQYAPE